MEISGFVTNLNAYNNGRLVGEMVKFPCKEEDFAEVLNRIEVADGHEWFISDVDCKLSGIGREVEFYSLKELNEVAKRIAEDWENDEFTIAVCETFGIDAVLRDFESDYIFYHAHDYEELGRELVDLLCMAIPTDLEYYINYEEYGRDYAINVGGEFSSNGYFVERA